MVDKYSIVEGPKVEEPCVHSDTFTIVIVVGYIAPQSFWLSDVIIIFLKYR